MGVKAVIATSFESIHRSNLVGMGVLPLQFNNGESAASLGIDGSETFDITGLNATDVRPMQQVGFHVRRANGETIETSLTLRIDTPIELEYYKGGGILQYVLRQLLTDRRPYARDAS